MGSLLIPATMRPRGSWFFNRDPLHLFGEAIHTKLREFTTNDGRISSSSSKLLYGGGMATDRGSLSPFGTRCPGSPEVFCSGEFLQFLDGGSIVFYD
ncbi:hypothetical protein ARALYDRAFT_913949 [Arabidopsis lyrata subsp. lyrata]|uniref:Uncharacterized protein n=1 Tax=Arabidopsis lyrata subsp. lyrata TaxID=81972 RepID=D7MFC6_ARALL|nr:hypothetical protein ARALYDRAFT_913949 [Arabidopsis lyrata subsp. lyrata]